MVCEELITHCAPLHCDFSGVVLAGTGQGFTPHILTVNAGEVNLTSPVSFFIQFGLLLCFFSSFHSSVVCPLFFLDILSMFMTNPRATLFPWITSSWFTFLSYLPLYVRALSALVKICFVLLFVNPHLRVIFLTGSEY